MSRNNSLYDNLFNHRRFGLIHYVFIITIDMRNIKVKCKGVYNRTFTNVRFEYDWLYEEYVGDVEIRDGELYIQNCHIPIRRNLVASAFHEFKSLGSNIAYAELEFLITNDGNYMVGKETSSNKGDYILGKIFTLGLGDKRFYPPSLGERDY